jgi:hypothetical protein
MTSSQFSVTKRLQMLAFVLLAGISSRCDAGMFNVYIDTSALKQAPLNANSPFYLDLQFNDGGTLGNNSASVFFNYNGGGPTGTATLLGGATGDISTGVFFDNSSVFQEVYQAFNPGSVISLLVDLTQNLDGITPDSFVVAILDSNLQNITTNGLGDSLVQIDVNTTSVLAVNVGAGVGDYSEITLNAGVVPEPGSMALLAMGMAGLVFMSRRRK